MQPGVVVYNYDNTFFCCKVEKDRWCEEMVTENMVVYLCSGEMELVAPDRRYYLKKGDSFFLRRNHKLIKIKKPAKNGEPFKGLFLQLKMPFLKRFLADRKTAIPIGRTAPKDSPYVMLPSHPFLKGLFLSLEQYFDAQQYPSAELMELKLKEAVLALLQLKPELGQVLFDFASPWKMDLETFMNENYKSDLSVEQFAHYTARSLSTFKKDFAAIFGTTPSRWIVRRRLEEARLLLEQESETPSEVYLKVGFKNLSHFSTAFKREFGYSPSVNTKSSQEK